MAIRAMDAATRHRIAAGQAVQDLSSAVKELLDNAIDAGSQSIQIKLYNKGLDRIEVIDDGCGVPTDQRHLMALPHTTSKITTLEDLYSVDSSQQSLGFRGEALFCLANISAQLVISTKTQDDKIGTSFAVNRNGSVDESTQKQVPRKTGTTITIHKLFGNLPVRYGDLRKRINDQRDKLLQMVTCYALFAQNCRINLLDISNKGKKKILLSSTASNQLAANISATLGSHALEGMHPFELDIDLVESEDTDAHRRDDSPTPPRRLIVTGYLSRADAHQPTKHVKPAQYFALNGRPVDLPRVSRILNDIWRQLGLPKRPSCVLCLQAPNGAFDINVAPDKRQVIWTQEALFHKTVAEVVTQVWSKQRDGSFVAAKSSQSAARPSETSVAAKDKPPLKDAPAAANASRQTKLPLASHKSSPAAPRVSTEPPAPPPARQERLTSLWVVQPRPTKRPRVHSSIDDSHGERGSDEEDGEMELEDAEEEKAGAPRSERKSEAGEERSTGRAVAPTTAPDEYDRLIAQNEAVASTSERPSAGAQPSIDETSRRRADAAASFPVELEPNPSQQSMSISMSAKICPKRRSTSARPSLGSVSLASYETASEHKEWQQAKKRFNDRLNDDKLPNNFAQFQAGRASTSRNVDKTSETLPHPHVAAEQTEPFEEMEEKKDDESSSDVPSRQNNASTVQWRGFESTASVVRAAKLERFAMMERRRALRRRDDTAVTSLRLHKHDFANMYVIGQFNLGFILARSEDNHLWILDQHGCDEKANFEQLFVDTVFHEQQLIAPMKLDLSVEEENCIIEYMDVFEKNGFGFQHKPEAPPRERLQLTALPHSGAHDGRKAVQFGKEDVLALCEILSADCSASAYENAAGGGTGADGSGLYGNNAVRRYVSKGGSTEQVIARIPKAIAMFASRACRSSIMIGKALSDREMNQVVKRLEEVEHPWNCPHGRPTMQHVCDLRRHLKLDERSSSSFGAAVLTMDLSTQGHATE